MAGGRFTAAEIGSQTEAWEGALRAVEHVRSEWVALAARYGQVLFLGCGSTYYLSLAASHLFQQVTGCSARATPAGEFLFCPRAVLTDQPTLLVAVSRSGETTETVRAVEHFRQEGDGSVVVITNYGDRPLARLADLAVVIPQGQERSVAQTRSFTSMFVAASALATLAAAEDTLYQAFWRLPEIGARLLRDYDHVARHWGEDLALDRFYFLGSGLRYGLACEANLKMKEMSLTHSEPFHFLEFRHGPMSMVGAHTGVVGLLSEGHRRQEQAVLDEMGGLGAHVLSLGESAATVAFHSQLPELVRGVLYLPVLQRMAYYRSLAKGLDPDAPMHLKAVITLEDL